VMASKDTDMANQRPSDAIMKRAAEWRAKLHAGEALAGEWAAFTDWMDGAPEHAVAYDIVSENISIVVAIWLDLKRSARISILFERWNR